MTTTIPTIPQAPAPAEVDPAPLAAEYVRLGAVVAEAKERQEEIANQLRNLDYGTHQAGALTVSIQHNRRPNAAKVAEDYPQEQYPSIYKSALDLTAFKRYVAPVIVESYQIEGPAKVLVK
jgi:hypothetical protein